VSALNSAACSGDSQGECAQHAVKDLEAEAPGTMSSDSDSDPGLPAKRRFRVRPQPLGDHLKAPISVDHQQQNVGDEPGLQACVLLPSSADTQQGGHRRKRRARPSTPSSSIASTTEVEAPSTFSADVLPTTYEEASTGAAKMSMDAAEPTALTVESSSTASRSTGTDRLSAPSNASEGAAMVSTGADEHSAALDKGNQAMETVSVNSDKRSARSEKSLAGAHEGSADFVSWSTKASKPPANADEGVSRGAAELSSDDVNLCEASDEFATGFAKGSTSAGELSGAQDVSTSAETVPDSPVEMRPTSEELSTGNGGGSLLLTAPDGAPAGTGTESTGDGKVPAAPHVVTTGIANTAPGTGKLQVRPDAAAASNPKAPCELSAAADIKPTGRGAASVSSRKAMSVAELPATLDAVSTGTASGAPVSGKLSADLGSESAGIAGPVPGAGELHAAFSAVSTDAASASRDSGEHSKDVVDVPPGAGRGQSSGGELLVAPGTVSTGIAGPVPGAGELDAAFVVMSTDTGSASRGAGERSAAAVDMPAGTGRVDSGGGNLPASPEAESTVKAVAFTPAEERSVASTETLKSSSSHAASEWSQAGPEKWFAFIFRLAQYLPLVRMLYRTLCNEW
jgi:hypothetical protein